MMMMMMHFSFQFMCAVKMHNSISFSMTTANCKDVGD